MIYPRVSPGLKSGLSLVEMIVTIVIMVAMVGAFVSSLRVGEMSFPISSVKTDMQSKVRIAMEWMSKDIRQTPTYDIIANAATPSEVRFRRLIQDKTQECFAIAGSQYQLENDYIQYIYNQANQTLTRNVITPAGATTQTWQLRNITDPPFFTRNEATGGNTVALNAALLTATNPVIIITLNALGQARGTLIRYTLTTEVKIRNGQ